MKNYFIQISFVIVALMISTSCNDDFMERYPLDEISNETFWNTENDLRAYNNNLYGMASSGTNILSGHAGFSESPLYLDGFADNMAVTNDRMSLYMTVRAGVHQILESARDYGWRPQGWSFVRAINIGLANYDNADVAESIKNRYKGEARLFRGWFYADMVSRFGDVPWVDKELNIDSEELFAERTPREEVMTNVLADLNFACDNLPADWGDGNAPGRLNRWAALAVKSRFCLFEGTWRKYHGGSNPDMWLQEAADAAKEIMDNGPYSLYVTGDIENDYNATHRMADLSGNPEVIYWIKYQEAVRDHINIPAYHLGYSGGATKSLVEDYLCSDGLPISLSPLYQGDEVFEDIFENRDPRLRQSVLHPADQPKYEYGNHPFEAFPYPRLAGMVGGEPSETGYHIIKHFLNSAVLEPNGFGTFPALVMRYGEVLLNYAEAKAELGDLTQSDLDISINLLRDRVAMPHLDINNVPVDPRYVNDGLSPLLVEIRRERRIELAMEGFRYNDIRRWKQGKKLEIPDLGIRWDENYQSRIDPEGLVVLQTTEVDGIPYIDPYKGTEFENPVFNESKHYLWPIPLDAISQNPNLKQTQGWENN